MMRTYPILDDIGAVLLPSLFALLLLAQFYRPLRLQVQRFLSRAWANLLVAAPSYIILRLLLIPAVVAVARWADHHQLGLVRLVPLPGWLAAVIAILVLDYSMFLWHWCNHRLVVLWRFHRVHHSDLDLDVTTALRFHAGEIALSVLVRSLQVLVAGASPAAALAYEVLLEVSTQFHHSNLRLPLPVERALGWFIMTPRAHGIHHSIEARESNRNFSNFLILWDRLHGTRYVDVRPETLVIGVRDCQDPQELTPWKLFLLPFRASVSLPSDSDQRQKSTDSASSSPKEKGPSP